MMGSRKVLVVLDDVDDITQLEALAGKLTWFKQGSKIIITTRDEQVLVAHGVNIIHDVNLLSYEEALCLFSRYAFKNEIPNQGYEDLSRKVVHYAAALPLTIKVLGSHLCRRTNSQWVDAIERLKTIPNNETLERLEVSYNGLENDQKEIFLDVVCILKGEKKDDAMRVLDSCGYYAEIGLSVLEQKSLITISGNDRLSFHDRIEEMGRNIVRRSHPEEPSRHSRLCDKEEIEYILVNQLGTKETRSIKLHFSNLDEATIMKGLRKMEKLRLLDVISPFRNVKDDEVSQYYLPDTLQSLHWYAYPFRSLPETFKTNKLVNLKMHRSNIHELWKEGEKKVLNKLKFLDLCYSMEITTLDLRATPHLEVLNLEGCKHLIEFQLPDECLNLKILNLSGSKVSSIKLGLVPCLEELNLKGCKHLVEFQLPDECLKLKILNLSGSKVSSIKLGLDLWRLQSLEKLSLYYQQFRHLPDSICMLKHLKSLKLYNCSSLEKLPENICELECLEKLCIKYCRSLGDIPDSICKMKCLKSLYLYGYRNIKKLPEELGSLECLKLLWIDSTGISGLPQSIYQLKGLTIYGSNEQLESCGFTSILKEQWGTRYYVEL